MQLFLVKPDLMHYEAYLNMMDEWRSSGTQIAPWFLGIEITDEEDFARFVRMLDNCSHGILDPQYAATTSYFVMDERARLIGAGSLRHYLTPEGLRTWGHIGYGIRPSERRKGYAVQTLQLLLQQAAAMKIPKALIGVHEGNVGSWKTVERCGGMLENTVLVPGEEEPIRRYWINTKDS